MPFSLGAIEALLVVATFSVAFVCYFRSNHLFRLSIAGSLCVALAALVTPADLTSTVLMSIAFGAVFLFGNRFPITQPMRLD